MIFHPWQDGFPLVSRIETKGIFKKAVQQVRLWPPCLVTYILLSVSRPFVTALLVQFRYRLTLIFACFAIGVWQDNGVPQHRGGVKVRADLRPQLHHDGWYVGKHITPCVCLAELFANSMKVIMVCRQQICCLASAAHPCPR